MFVWIIDLPITILFLLQTQLDRSASGFPAHGFFLWDIFWQHPPSAWNLFPQRRSLRSRKLADRRYMAFCLQSYRWGNQWSHGFKQLMHLFQWALMADWTGEPLAHEPFKLIHCWKRFVRDGWIFLSFLPLVPRSMICKKIRPNQLSRKVSLKSASRCHFFQ